MIPSLRREEEKRKKGEEEILSSFLSSFLCPLIFRKTYRYS